MVRTISDASHMLHRNLQNELNLQQQINGQQSGHLQDELDRMKKEFRQERERMDERYSEISKQKAELQAKEQGVREQSERERIEREKEI